MWWTFGQAINYLTANRPCNDKQQANNLLVDKVRDGTIATQYQDDGSALAISPSEWHYQPTVPFGTSTSTLSWEGAEISHDSVHYDAAAVRRLCMVEA